MSNLFFLIGSKFKLRYIVRKRHKINSEISQQLPMRKTVDSDTYLMAIGGGQRPTYSFIRGSVKALHTIQCEALAIYRNRYVIFFYLITTLDTMSKISHLCTKFRQYVMALPLGVGRYR